MQLYEDIPRLYTALAEWGACLSYLYLLKGKIRQTSFWIISVIALMAQVIFLVLTGGMPTIFWIPCMAVAAVFMYSYLMICGELNVLSTFYCCARAFLMAELAASLEWQLHTYLKAVGISNPLVSIGTLAFVYGSCFIGMIMLEKPLLTQEYLKQLTIREVLSVIGIVLVVFAFSNLSFVIGNSPFTSKLRADIFNIRTLADLAGVAILHAYQSRICEYAAEKELSKINGVLKSQYDQYRNYQDSVDLIQMKYHDLKHQIAGLRAETDEQKRKEWLDAMEEEVTAFENVNKTGNQVLDTILAAKIFHCRKNKIQITCVADGKLLDFMHVTDICTIFGNALDNAIESVVLIPEEEKRLIHVQVSAKKGFIFIKAENYCEGEIVKNEKELIDTTKLDKKNHGFGLKSIRYAVEKYDGTINFRLHNQWFELNILLPQKEVG